LKPLFAAVALILSAAASANAETPQPTPGLVTGHVVDGAGRPLAGAALYLGMLAVSGPPLRGKTDDTGAYTVKTTHFPLLYRAHAWMPLAYRGKKYCIRIAPETEADKTEISGLEGAIRNFRWKVQGPVDPSGLDQDSDSAFYGGTLRLMLDFEDGGYDAALNLELTPDGPLIDGSTGKALSFHVDLKRSPFVYDIPIGAYTVRGTRTTSDGRRTTVRLGPNRGDAKETATLAFNPHDTSLPCGSATTDNGIDRAFLTVVAP
jgi:hypothetical protein